MTAKTATNTNHEILPAYVQGSQEWLELRKTKITATDAAVIMGASPWKSKHKLYEEKVLSVAPMIPTDRMQRGLDLEPIARDLFTIKTGIEVSPRVIVDDWRMASLDGISDCGKYIVEIKCPGDHDHALAMSGRIPEHYYPQLQHQMAVCNVESMYYFSFDGVDGVTIMVHADKAYQEKLYDQELKFYECMLTKTPPAPDECRYTVRDDDIWIQCAISWKECSQKIKELEKEEESLRKKLIFLSGESNSSGAGISLCKVERKGNVDYSSIPCLKGLDLEPYRKESSSSWRITSK